LIFPASSMDSDKRLSEGSGRSADKEKAPRKRDRSDSDSSADNRREKRSKREREESRDKKDGKERKEKKEDRRDEKKDKKDRKEHKQSSEHKEHKRKEEKKSKKVSVNMRGESPGPLLTLFCTLFTLLFPLPMLGTLLHSAMRPIFYLV